MASSDIAMRARRGQEVVRSHFDISVWRQTLQTKLQNARDRSSSAMTTLSRRDMVLQNMFDLVLGISPSWIEMYWVKSALGSGEDEEINRHAGRVLCLLCRECGSFSVNACLHELIE